MPPKLVYGKRPNKASAFAVSTVFLSSSPTKSSSRPTTASSLNGKDESIAEAASALERLTLKDKYSDYKDIGKHEKHTTTPRKALASRDGNSRGPRKPRVAKEEEPGFSKEKLDTAKNQEVPQIKTTSHSATLPLQRPLITPHLPESLLQPDPTCDPYISPLISLTNDQTSPITFSEWSESLCSYFHISKIAEASYGEVYRLSLLAPHPQFTSADESVLKVLALKPSPSLAKPAKKKNPVIV